MNDDQDDDTTVVTLANGVRVLAIRIPHAQTASASIFVRSGSAHESVRLNGVSHFVEHMVFKGSATRDVRRINLDAERLGAEVNAHTDKDHTAFHMRGLAAHALPFVRMLGDIVLAPTFPAAELERERDVLLQEYAETEDDPMTTAFELFDRACFGLHGAAQPVIGTRRNIERLQRADLAAWVQGQYSGANLVVGVAGAIDPDAVAREAEAVFGGLPAGMPNEVAPAAYVGDVRSKRHEGSSQSHLVLGFPIAPLGDDDEAPAVAAALFGEGMSSPLMDELRERRGLVYYAASSADRFTMCGQFVVEASTAPERADEFLRELLRLLRRQAEGVDPVDLERAHNQLLVKRLQAHEKPWRRLEDAALDLFVRGRVRSADELLQRIAAVDADAVQRAFAQMLAAGASVALTGQVGRGASERVRQALAG